MKGYKMGYYQYAYGEYEDKVNLGYLLSPAESAKIRALNKAREEARIAELKAKFAKKYNGKF